TLLPLPILARGRRRILLLGYLPVFLVPPLLNFLQTSRTNSRCHRLMVLRCNPTADNTFQPIHELGRTHLLIDTDRRSKLLQLSKLRLILLHRHRALGQTQELLHPLVTNMPRKILLTENPEKILPSNTRSMLEDSAKRRVPPRIGVILKSESSKLY